MEITFQELKDRILKLRENGEELILKHIDELGLLLQIYEEVAYETEVELLIDVLLFDATKYELCCDGGGNTLSFLKELKVDNKIYYTYGLYTCPGWYDETYDMSVVGHFVLSVEEKEVIGKPNNMTELATKVVSLLKETEVKTESSEDFDVFGNKIEVNPVLAEICELTDKFEAQFGYPLMIPEPYGVADDVLELAKISMKTNTDLLSAYLDKTLEENVNPSAVYGYGGIMYKVEDTGLKFTDEEIKTSETCKNCGKQGIIRVGTDDWFNTTGSEYCPHCKNESSISDVFVDRDELDNTPVETRNTFSWVVDYSKYELGASGKYVEKQNNSHYINTDDSFGFGYSALENAKLLTPQFKPFGVDSPFSDAAKFGDKPFKPTQVASNKKGRGIKGLWGMFKR